MCNMTSPHDRYLYMSVVISDPGTDILGEKEPFCIWYVFVTRINDKIEADGEQHAYICSRSSTIRESEDRTTKNAVHC